MYWPKYFRALTLVVIFLFAGLLQGQDSSPYWFAQGEKAIQYANQQQVPLLVVFAGSDWCVPCIKFKKSILTDTLFRSYATEHVALLYLDFPIKKKNKLGKEQQAHNEKWAAQYNTNGSFPHVVLLSSAGEKIAGLKFHNQSPQTFIDELEAAQ